MSGLAWSPVRRYGHEAAGNRAVLVVRLLDQVFDDAVRCVNVLEGAMLQSMGKLVVFFFRDVVMRTVKQFERSVIAASVSEVIIDRRMVVQILAIVNRSSLDLIDGFVDLGNGVIFFSIHPMGPCLAFQVSARVAQVGEGVQVCRMSSRFIGEAQRGADGNKKYDYGTMSCNFHSLL
jgi:hypothetical protein